MSNDIGRDIARLAWAADMMGVTDVILDVQHTHTRWKFHLKGKYKGKTFLAAFNPKDRTTGGAQRRQIKSFEAKKKWALKEGFLFYTPKRKDPTNEHAKYRLQKWLSGKGIL